MAFALEELEEETGKRIRIALEPEPGCTIETVVQAADFLADVAPEWIGVCLDACHLAVQFESPDGALGLLEQAGVPVVKAQVSSALRVAMPGVQSWSQNAVMRSGLTLMPGRSLSTRSSP